ncbi:MAG: DUF2924 domain-containing protein [Phycisphaeraceae bacterium]|nr:DUF2924 domain-containing protein [Phycisphaeraceae bacterium]
MSAPVDLSALPRMSIDDLRDLWKEHIGRSPPPVQKRLLIRELAWRVQERAHGGLDAETARLLKSAIRNARQSTPSPESSQPTGPSRRRQASSTARGPRVANELPPGTRLVREWRGRTHEVTVIEARTGGKTGRSFRYRDQTFKTLTEVARAITGIHWSGPRFFGLITSRKPESP